MNVVERFLKYVSYETTSDEHSDTFPSSPKELVLGRFLEEELRAIGMDQVRMDEYGYVYGELPASEGVSLPALGLIAHMDTSPAVSGADIKPSRILYEGGDIALNPEVSIKADEFECLEKYVGQELLVTDGTTLLGADDKAGVAEIVTAMEYLINHPEIKHRKISVAFTPDEEIGCGTDHFDLDAFDASYAYTVDGGALGEIEYECFNGAAARIVIHGVNIHPGSAKNKMKNAVLIGSQLIGMLPAAEAPAHTEGYEGFYHVCEFHGNESQAVIEMIIRDHDKEIYEARKTFVADLADYLNKVYGEGTVCAEIEDSYRNMREKIEPVMYIIDEAKTAMEEAGVAPVIQAIRGGTDGAALSFKGLPCPNLSTGGENFHSIHEFIPVPSMEKMTEVVLNLCRA